MNAMQTVIVILSLVLHPTIGDVQRCADEGELCECYGEVVYGRKYQRGKPGSGSAASFDQVIGSPHKKKWVTGQIMCDDTSFGNPMVGYDKACHCNSPLHGFEDGQDSGPSDVDSIVERRRLQELTCADDVQWQCCSYNTNYQMVPMVTWGKTPQKEKQWHKDNNCDVVMGGRDLTNCPCEKRRLVHKGDSCGETADCAGDLVCGTSGTCVEAFTMVFFSDLENHYRNFEDAHSYGFMKNLRTLGSQNLKYDGEFSNKKIDNPKMLIHGGDLSRDRWAAEWRPRWSDITNAQVTIDEEFKYVWDQTYKAGIPAITTYGNHDWSWSVPNGAQVNENVPLKKKAEKRRCAGQSTDAGLQSSKEDCANECAIRIDPETRFIGFKEDSGRVPCKCYKEASINGDCKEEKDDGVDLFIIRDGYAEAAERRTCGGGSIPTTRKPTARSCGFYCGFGWYKTAMFSYGTNDFGADGCNDGGCLCVCHRASHHPGECEEEQDDDRFRLYKMTHWAVGPGAPGRDIKDPEHYGVGLDKDWSRDEQHHDNMMTRDMMKRTFEKSAKLGLKYQAIKNPGAEFGGPIDYVSEYKGIQVVMFGTSPFEESYNKDYKGVEAKKQLELVKKAVNYDMPTLVVSHYPIHLWRKIYGDDRYDDFTQDFLCKFKHVTYLDGHIHKKNRRTHECGVTEYTAPYRAVLGALPSGAWALLVSPQDGVLQGKFVPVNEKVEGDSNACIPEGKRCLPGTTCQECCLDEGGERHSQYWWGLLHHGCGKEPKWEDGRRCAAGTSCNHCENSYTWWHSKFGHACGKEDKWEDGRRCAAGTSCNQCKNGYEWWETKFGHHCGKEPCWKKGKVCGAGTTCKKCCKVPKVPWYQFGIGHCK